MALIVIITALAIQKVQKHPELETIEYLMNANSENSKHEILNSKQIRNSKNPKRSESLEH